MCIGIPCEVVEVEGQVAQVRRQDRVESVSLLLLDEPVSTGDYLLVQVGGFASERLSRARGQAALKTLQALVSGPSSYD